MKRVIMACLLFSFLLASCILEYQTILRTTDHLITAVSNQDTPIGLYRAQQEWQSSKSLLSGLIRHNEIDQIENLYRRAIQAAENQDKNETRLHVAELTGVLAHLPEMEFPYLHNIF